jgi:hypothetical protein
MRGANAVPWPAIISNPNRIMTIKIGSSQNFFLALKKAHSSLIKSKLTIISPKY